ncbi:hypothetical protein [Fusibacter ferrireducens]|uniref:Haemolysin-type calcium binding-related domain-containing protein n=1 Tax=Fusibacter ferrireducens TaxID=2785058 RepID=A0ABR9ZQZ1_9FIRM|nr:hypothetical protein [Fusibacter ferrireducens]MBF4692873.1 hypothetical protein [Fusibacter ferrireducens]
MRISNYSLNQSAFSKSFHHERQVTKLELSNPKAIMLRQLKYEDALELSHANVTSSTNELFELPDAERMRLQLLESFITALIGREFKFSRIIRLDQEAGSGNSVSSSFGFQFSSAHEVYESEKMSFESKGVIKTEDGRKINFQMNLNYSREYYEKNETIVQFGGVMQDPLVLNLDGKGIAFGDDSIRLDIDLDGKEDTFRRLASGSGFLALDQNENGIIDDGSELFGPRTGSGFGELEAYDQDHNGWIDENDDVFNSLKIWQVDAQGNSKLLGLKESGVGAIYLGAVDSSYHIKEGLETISDIKRSSAYVREDGKSLAIHEIDLKI